MVGFKLRLVLASFLVLSLLKKLTIINKSTISRKIRRDNIPNYVLYEHE